MDQTPATKEIMEREGADAVASAWEQIRTGLRRDQHQALAASVGRIAFGRTRSPKATFSKIVMWPNRA